MAYWVVVSTGSFQKRSTLPPRRKFLPSGGGGETKLFLIIVNVLGHPKGVGGLTSNFLCGGGMDVFWNDPLIQGSRWWSTSEILTLLGATKYIHISQFLLIVTHQMQNYYIH
jgi:hypothetical protein